MKLEKFKISITVSEFGNLAKFYKTYAKGNRQIIVEDIEMEGEEDQHNTGLLIDTIVCYPTLLKEKVQKYVVDNSLQQECFSVTNSKGKEVMQEKDLDRITIKIPEIIKQRPFLEKEQLKKAFPNIPLTFLPRTCFSIGTMKFKGGHKYIKSHFFKEEKYPVYKSKLFNDGEEYPVYKLDDEGEFVIGKDEKAHKIIPHFWTKIKLY